jgi:hypothetical protein
MNINNFSKVLISAAVAALFLVPMSFVILQTDNNQAKSAKAYYNPDINVEYYYGTNGTGQYYNSTFDTYPDTPNYINRYDSYNTHYTPTGEAIAVSDFKQPSIFDVNGNYSYSNDYKVNMNCNYHESYNCSNFPLPNEPNYTIYDNYPQPSIFDNSTTIPYNYYDPYQPTLQDPTKTWDYPKENFDGDNGIYNS